MSKKIALKFNNNTKYCGRGIYAGIENNFHYIIKYDNTSLLASINFNVIGEENIKKLTSIVKKDIKDTTVKYKNNKLSIVVGCNRKTDLPDLIKPIILNITSYLKNNNYNEVCKNCGQVKKNTLVDDEGEISFICNDCYKDIYNEAKYKENQNKKNKERLLLGTLGAIIGTIPGIIIWLILSFINIEPSIASIIITLGSALGYKYFSKNIKVPGLIISITVGLLGIIIAHELNCSLYIFELYKDNYQINLFDAYKAIPYYLNKIPEFKKSFYSILSTAYILSITGIFTSYSFYRQSTYKIDIKKLGDNDEKKA